MTEPIPIFNCTACGICCKSIGPAILRAKQLVEAGNADEKTAEIASFPFAYDSNGTCEKLLPDNTCSVYDSRPDICSVEKTWAKYHQEYFSIERYFSINELACMYLQLANEKNNQPAMNNSEKTLLLQVVTKDIESYAIYSTQINKSYAHKHGYDFKIVDNVRPNRHAAWAKVDWAMRELFVRGYGRVFVLDADAFINNHDITLDSFDFRKPINICRNDQNGGELLNTGSIVYQNFPNTVDLLLKWYHACEGTRYTHDYFWEQSIFNSLHNSGQIVPLDPAFAEMTAVYDSRAFNSWWLDPTPNYYNPSQFVMHVMARSTEEKTAIMQGHYNRFFKL